MDWNRHWRTADFVDDGKATLSSAVTMTNYLENPTPTSDHAYLSYAAGATVRQTRQYTIQNAQCSSCFSWKNSKNNLGLTDASGAWVKVPYFEGIWYYDVAYHYIWVTDNGYLAFPNAGGLLGQYYKGIDSTFPSSQLWLTRTDPTIDFTWGTGSPDPSIPADSFSVRWTGWLRVDRADAYTFKVQADDGVKFYLDDRVNPKIGAWQDTPYGPVTYSVSLNLNAGMHWIRLEYYDHFGNAQVTLSWNNPSVTGGQDAQIPVDNQYVDPGSRLPGQDGGSMMIPDSAAPNNMLAAWWRNMNPAKGGSVTWGTDVKNGVGSYFVVSWDKVALNADATKLQSVQVQFTLENEQVALNDRNTWIRIVYRSVSSPSPNEIVLVGNEDEIGTKGTSYSSYLPGQYPTTGVVVEILPGSRDMNLKNIYVKVAESDTYDYLEANLHQIGGFNIQQDTTNPTLENEANRGHVIGLVGDVMSFGSDFVPSPPWHYLVLGAGSVLTFYGNSLEWAAAERALSAYLLDTTTQDDGKIEMRANGVDSNGPMAYPSVFAFSFNLDWLLTDNTNMNFHNQPHSFTVDTTVEYAVGPRGASTTSITNHITVTLWQNQAPVIGTSLASPTASINTPVTWTFGVYDSNGDDVQYTLNFGDGSVSQPGLASSGGSASVSHTYSNPGDYAVTLTLDDRLGGVTQYTATAHIFAYTLTIQVSDAAAGNTNPTPGTYGYGAGTQVPVTATASGSNQLRNWMLDGVTQPGAPLTFTVTMNANHVLKANFGKALTISSSGTLGYTTPAAGTYYYPVNAQASIRAYAYPLYGFVYWTIDGGTTHYTDNPITVTMGADHTLTPYYGLPTGCVAEGTVVMMADGTRKPVEDVTVGDSVLGYDVANKTFLPETVLLTTRTLVPVTLSFNDGDLRVTPYDQPIYVRTAGFEGWVRDPIQIQVGWQLYLPGHGKWTTVKSVDMLTENVWVYDFVLSGPRTYVANSVLVMDKVGG